MNTIPSTELILNEDGSIYHLHLKPGDIADTIILVGDPDRVGMVSKYFDKIIIKKQKREFVTHTGFFKKKMLTVISTGIGTDNIDIVLNELDALANIDFKKRKIKSKLTSLNFIRVGTSGALQKNTPVDSIVISEMAIGMDGLMNYYPIDFSNTEKNITKKFKRHLSMYSYPKNNLIALPYTISASPELAALFSDKAINGTTISTSGFYAPQGRVLRGKLTMKNYFEVITGFSTGDVQPTNFEMETSAIYGLSRILGHRAVSCNAIIGNRVTKQFSEDSYKMVDKLIRFVLERI